MPTVQIPITVDAFIRGDAEAWRSWNNGAHHQIVVGSAFTGLIKPDLSSVPVGATVISAILYLYNKNASQTGTNTISVHRMLKDWGEGDKLDDPATTGESNWTYAKHDTSAWATAGAKGASDRAATATFSLGKNLADPDGWISGLEVDADVQAWVGGTAPNYGWGLYGSATGYVIFSSSDAEGDFGPYLEVEYSTGGDSTDIIISPDPPVVTVTPVGGAERALRLEGHPSYSVARGIGYEAASIPVAFEDMSAPDLQGAEVHIHGTGWRGVIVKRPVPGKPLIVMGKGAWVGSLKRTSALYADNRLRQWREWQDAAVGSGAIRPAITPSAAAWWIGLTKGEQPYTVDEWSDATNRGSGITPPVVTAAGVWLGLTNGVQAVGACGMQFFDPANGVNRIQATWSKAANTNFGLIVYRGTVEGVVSATPYAYNTGTGGSIDVSLPAGTTWAAVCLAVSPEWTPNAPGLGILISALAVNGTPVWYRRAGIDYYDERGITNLRFAWSKPATASYGVMVLRGDSEGVIAGTPLTLQNSTGGTVDLAMPPGTKWVAIALATNAWRVPNLAAQGIAISGIVVNGRGLTTVDTQTVADNIIDSDIDSPYGLTPIAAYPFIQHSPWVLSPLMFDATDMNTKFATLMERASIEYGWYEGRHWDLAALPVDAFPHVWDRPTAPAYLLPLHSCEELPQLELSSLDEMTSGTYVTYERPDGMKTTYAGPDQDETHPLVALGIQRYGEITAQVDSDTAAGMVAWEANAENGRQRVRGSVTVRTLLTIDGAVADLTAVRGGDIVRLTGSEAGAIDVRLLRMTVEGELITLEFDSGDYRLDALLANLSARAG